MSTRVEITTGTFFDSAYLTASNIGTFTLPNYGFEGGGKTLADAGAVLADDLRPHKARILLMLALQNGVAGQKALQAVFDR